MKNVDFPVCEGAVQSRMTGARRAGIMALAAVLALAVAGCKQQAAAPTDQQIASGIQSRIQGESALAGQNIQVSVSNGVATLSGTVPDAASRSLAGVDSGAVPGVKTVVNNLMVQPAQAAPATPAAAPAAEPARETGHNHRPQMARTEPAPQPVHKSAPTPVQKPASQQAMNEPAAAHPATPPAPPQPVVKTVTLAQGTPVPVVLTEALSSKTASPNDTFHATLASDLVSNGVVVIPRGAPVLGRVVDAKDATHFTGRSLLALELTQVAAHGQKVSLVTNTLSEQGAARGKNTAEKAVGGALLGALIGGLAGGGKGAAIGAAAGGGAGTGVNAVTRGQQVNLPTESQLSFRLQSPVTLTVTIPPPGESQPRPNYEPQLQTR